MNELIKIGLGVVFLIFGWFIGKFLANITLEELKSGKKWFKLIIFVSFIGAITSLIFRNDVLMFTFLFITIVTAGSLKN